MPAGRPTSYRPEFCARVIEYGALGKSRAWMAAELAVSRDTLNEWERVNPEFSVSMAIGRLKAQQWWEDIGQTHVTAVPGGPTINAGVYSRSMAARFSDDWRENKGVEVSGSLKVEGITRTVIDPNAPKD